MGGGSLFVFANPNSSDPRTLPIQGKGDRKTRSASFARAVPSFLRRGPAVGDSCLGWEREILQRQVSLSARIRMLAPKMRKRLARARIHLMLTSAFVLLYTFCRRGPQTGPEAKTKQGILCPNAITGLREGSETWDVPKRIIGMFSTVEHVFILAKHECSKRVDTTFRRHFSCVRGAVLDGCAPQKYIRAPEAHAMKVTFSHAFIMSHAHTMGYSTIAVVEEDAVFLQRNYSKDVLLNFSHLLRSSDWGIIRLGFRPYFLQVDAVSPCPQKCRCDVGRFGDHWCELRSAGCDMRSSDAYIINIKHYLPFREMLLDLRVSNRDRIVDTVPIRMISHQWLLLPQASYQAKLDIPLDYQIGLSALYTTKCVHPRPVPELLVKQMTWC